MDIDAEQSLHRNVGRDAARDGAERAEALHRERYGPADAAYIAQADPVELADIVVDNTDLDNPPITRR